MLFTALGGRRRFGLRAGESRSVLEAGQVRLASGSLIDASAVTGGGEVLIGGDYQGKNPEIYNAQTTLIEAGAEVRADALSKGDGGRMIVWADDTTRFAGAVSARGGSEGGMAASSKSPASAFSTSAVPRTPVRHRAVPACCCWTRPTSRLRIPTSRPGSHKEISMV
jgi:hypothetical protein